VRYARTTTVTHKVGEGAALLLQQVDLLDISVLTEVRLYLFDRIRVKVVDVADVNVPRASGSDDGGDTRGTGARGLTPSDLESTILDGDSRRDGVLIEGDCGLGEDKGDKADVLVWNVSDLLQDTATYGVTDVLACGVGVEVADCTQAER